MSSRKKLKVAAGDADVKERGPSGIGKFRRTSQRLKPATKLVYAFAVSSSTSVPLSMALPYRCELSWIWFPVPASPPLAVTCPVAVRTTAIPFPLAHTSTEKTHTNLRPAVVVAASSSDDSAAGIGNAAASPAQAGGGGVATSGGEAGREANGTEAGAAKGAGATLQKTIGDRGALSDRAAEMTREGGLLCALGNPCLQFGPQARPTQRFTNYPMSGRSYPQTPARPFPLRTPT